MDTKIMAKPSTQFTELLTWTQRLWRKLMDQTGLPADERARLTVEMLTTFSAACYLKTLHEIDPEKAAEACQNLQEVIDDGSAVGEWTWQWLSDMGIDPESITPAA